MDRFKLKKSELKKYLLTPLEYDLLLCLAYNGIEGNHNGWLESKQIFSIKEQDVFYLDKHKEQNDERPLFKSQNTNLPKYITKLLEKGYIQEDKITRPSNRKDRTANPKIWRIKQNPKTALIIMELFNIYDEYLGLIELENFFDNKIDMSNFKPKLYTLGFEKSHYFKSLKSSFPKEYAQIQQLEISNLFNRIDQLNNNKTIEDLKEKIISKLEVKS